MPSVAVKLYSVFFKFMLKHRLQNRIQNPADEAANAFGFSTRPEESVAASNPSFIDGVATKDIHIDPFTSLSIRIFLPDSALSLPELLEMKSRPRSNQSDNGFLNFRRNSFGVPNLGSTKEESRRSSLEALNLRSETAYKGYSPSMQNCRKLPIMLQFPSSMGANPDFLWVQSLSHGIE